MASNGRPDCSDLSDMLSGPICFYVFADHIAEAAGKFAAQRQGAQQRRRQAANGMSRRDLVKEFAGSAENEKSRTKALWKPYYSYLNELGLNPAQRDGIYEYNGKNGRLTISYRQFEKLVSELAPRKPTTALIDVRPTYREFPNWNLLPSLHMMGVQTGVTDECDR